MFHNSSVKTPSGDEDSDYEMVSFPSNTDSSPSEEKFLSEENSPLKSRSPSTTMMLHSPSIAPTYLSISPDLMPEEKIQATEPSLLEAESMPTVIEFNPIIEITTPLESIEPNKISLPSGEVHPLLTLPELPVSLAHESTKTETCFSKVKISARGFFSRCQRHLTHLFDNCYPKETKDIKTIKNH